LELAGTHRAYDGARCECVRDYVARDLLQQIRDDAEGHIDFLETRLEPIGKPASDALRCATRPRFPLKMSGRLRPAIRVFRFGEKAPEI
jgi:hypothetical protein